MTSDTPPEGPKLDRILDEDRQPEPDDLPIKEEIKSLLLELANKVKSLDELRKEIGKL